MGLEAFLNIGDWPHTLKDIDYLIECYAKVFEMMKDAIQNNTIQSSLECEPLKPLFSVR